MRTLSTVAVLAALAALALLGLRRRRSDVVAACVLSLALVAALGVAASSVPKTAFGTVGYSLWWASAVGLFAWLTMGWSAATLFALGRRLPSVSRPALAGAAGVAVDAAVGVVVAVDANRRDEPIDQMRAVSDRLQAVLPAGQAVRVDAQNPTDVFSAAGFQLGIVYAMRRDGRDVQAPSVARYLGDRYRRDDSANPAIVNVDVDRAPIPGSRVVVDATARRPRAQVLTDLHYPGWKATVDGRPADLRRVDWLLRATPLPAGRHRVELRYEPASWRAGWIVSLFALVALAATLVVGLRARRRPAAGSP